MSIRHGWSWWRAAVSSRCERRSRAGAWSRRQPCPAPAQDRVDVWTTHPLENVFRNATKPQRATTTSRVESTSGSDGLESVAFRNADDGSKALIVVTLASK